MKKILSIFVVAILALVLVACKGGNDCPNPDPTPDPTPVARTYVADGTYVAWSFAASEKTAKLKTPADENVVIDHKYFAPELKTVEVEIRGDKIVGFNIDCLQSHFVPVWNAEGTALELGHGKSHVAFNEATKKQLTARYGMNFMKTPDQPNIYGEWYIHAQAIEKAMLDLGIEEAKTSEIVTTSTIHHDIFFELAKEAVAKAKAGKVGAIVAYEHYKNDVTFVEGKISAEGVISELKVNAMLVAADGTVADKYETYGPMKDGVKWQDQIDAFNTWLNQNKWRVDITFGKTNNKGVLVAGETPEALTSVTIQMHGEVEALHKLFKYFPLAY